jgi:hypothetical protein
MKLSISNLLCVGLMFLYGASAATAANANPPSQQYGAFVNGSILVLPFEDNRTGNAVCHSLLNPNSPAYYVLALQISGLSIVDAMSGTDDFPEVTFITVHCPDGTSFSLNLE